MNKLPATEQPRIKTNPLLTQKERASIWEKARGIWKNRRPDPVKELKKIRKEWERNF